MFRRKLRNVNRDWKNKDYEELIKSAEIDIGTFFKTVKAKRNKKENTSCIKYKGVVSETPEEKCQTWGTYYTDLLSETLDGNFDETFKRKIEEDIPIIASESYDELDNITDREIEISEVKAVIRELKQGKSPGPDLITNEHLANGGPTLHRI